MTDPRPFWTDVYRIFDPEQPATAAERAERKDYNTIAHLERKLSRPDIPRKVAIGGPRGSGKSTELASLASRLGTSREVVFLDLVRHFHEVVRDQSALGRLAPWELCGLLGTALYKAAAEAKLPIDLEHHRRRLGAALDASLARVGSTAAANGPKLDLGKLAQSMFVGVGGALAGAATGTPTALVELAGSAVAAGTAAAAATAWTWAIGLPGRPATTDQDTEVRGVLAATNALIYDVQFRLARRVLFVVDGLDRVDDLGALRDIFVESSLLDELAGDIVCTVSLPLLWEHQSTLRGFEAHELVNLPVLDPADVASPLYGKGCPFFHEVVRRRLAQIQGAPPNPISQRI